MHMARVEIAKNAIKLDHLIIPIELIQEARKQKLPVVVPERDALRMPCMLDLPDFTDQPDDYQKGLATFCREYQSVIAPLVSIAIPTYNNPIQFEKTLQSALAQDYPNLEIIVGDDSTNNATAAVIEPYLAEHQHLRYINNHGPLGEMGDKNARNILSKCYGDFINLLFHDDLIFPTKISKQVEILLRDSEEELAFVIARRNWINDNGEVLREPEIRDTTPYSVINARAFGKNYFQTFANQLGEVSFTLVRRTSNFGKKYPYGEFCGVPEAAMFDISSWLDLGRRQNFAINNEVLGSFRLSGGGNKPSIQFAI